MSTRRREASPTPHAKDAEAFLAKRVQEVEGGPRSLAQALETVHQCIARRGAQEDSLRSFFKRDGR